MERYVQDKSSNHKLSGGEQMLTLIPNKLQESIDDREKRERRQQIKELVIGGILIIAVLLIIGTVGYMMGVNV